MHWTAAAALRATLLVSPRPAALVVRKVFAVGGAQFKAKLDQHAPEGVVTHVDQRYGDEADMLLDVAHPDTPDGRLPLLVWVHGGGWVGGSKHELTGYLELLAANGYVVAGPDYSLAPEHRYPTPVRQIMDALEYLMANAERFHIDPDRVLIAGDSAGAHIAAQIGAIVTTPGYAEAIGLTPTITNSQLRGLVLACGPYDLGLGRHASSDTGRRLIKALLWAYSGRRDPLGDPAFATWSITENLTKAFPPTLLTVGNADPLRRQSEVLADMLLAEGVEHETVFFPDDHDPPLGHEYQFDLDSSAAQEFFGRLLAFLRRRLEE